MGWASLELGTEVRVQESDAMMQVKDDGGPQVLGRRMGRVD